MIRREGYIVWTTYFDASLSRSEGRRVPLKLAVKNPTQEILAKSLQKLGWQFEPLDKSHPAAWWRKKASILVKPPRKIKKTEVIRLIAEHMREKR